MQLPQSSVTAMAAATDELSNPVHTVYDTIHDLHSLVKSIRRESWTKEKGITQ